MSRRRVRIRSVALGAALASLASITAAAAADLGTEGTTELDCLIEPQQTVVVSAPVIGVVEQVLVDRGDLVEVGQVLAVLESSVEMASVEWARARAGADADAEVRASETRHAFETKRYKRTRRLFEQGVLSDDELDEAQSNLTLADVNRLQARENRDLARLELGRAEAVLERRTIHSPIQGVVVERLVAPGEYADPPQLLELAQLDPLRVEVFAPVSLFGKIAVGMRARVVAEELPGTTREAAVVVVDQVIDAASGTFGVRLELPNPGYELPSGLRCRVRF